jgi:zinc-finger-containing domain
VKIYCVACTQKVKARLTDGAEIYPHRPDLAAIPFWICDTCGNYVGCHYKTANPTYPLGIIATKELKAARMRIHALLDPLWKNGTWKRSELYEYISKQLGYGYHTANTRSIEETERVIEILEEISHAR